MVGPIPSNSRFQSSDPMGAPPSLYSGDVEMVHDSTYDNEGQVYYRISDPFPAIISAIMAHVVTENRQ